MGGPTWNRFLTPFGHAANKLTHFQGLCVLSGDYSCPQAGVQGATIGVALRCRVPFSRPLGGRF
jgi:hypothetical protein